MAARTYLVETADDDDVPVLTAKELYQADPDAYSGLTDEVSGIYVKLQLFL